MRAMRVSRAGMRVALPVVAVAAVLVGCGTSTIRVGGAEQSVAGVVSQKTGFHPSDVSSPSGVRATVGTTFDCHFTGPEPRPYVAHVRVTAVHGQRVDFQIDTEPEPAA
jgi:Domain of unknown function (DUF4333)